MNKKVLKAGLGYTVGNFLIKGLSFLTLPIFARILSVEDYGVYSVYLSYESILYIFVGLALHSCIKSAKYKYGVKFDDFVSSIIWGICINFLGMFLLANLIFPCYQKLIPFPLSVVNLLLVHSFGSAVITFYNTYVGLEYKYQNYLLISCFNAFANLFLSLLLLKTIFTDARYMGRIIGTVVPIILITIYVLCFFFKQSKPKIEKAYYWFALKYSLPIIPHGLSQVILAQSDRIMIDTYIGASATGLYSFAFNIYSILSIVIQSICSVWEPWAFERLSENDYGSVRKSGNLFSMGMFVMSALAILVSPELIKILGPRAYEPSKFVAIPILVGGFFSSMYNIPCILEYYKEKTNMIAIGTAFAAAVNLVLNYIFIRKYGYVAAAFTTMFTYILYFSFHYFISYKISDFFIVKKEILLCESVLLGVIATLSWILIENFIFRWGTAVLFTVISALVLWKQLDLKHIRYPK